MANKRIIDLTEIQNITEDDYVILDSNTDGTRKILASNIGGGSGSGVNYSTTEQDTGLKWIDGKPIYQKTYSEVLRSTLGNGATWYVMNDLLNKNVLHSVTTYTQEDANLFSITNFIGLACRSYTGLAELMIPGSLNLSIGGRLTATIWYTKTTDTV